MIQQKRVLARRLQQRYDSRMYRLRHRCDDNSDSRNSHCKARGEREREREKKEQGYRRDGQAGSRLPRTGVQ